MSFDLGARVVIVQAGRIPESDETPAARHLNEALRTLGQHGDRTGTTLALETGLDPGEKVAAYLARFDTAGLGVSYDPGNLIVNGFDPYTSLQALRGKVTCCQAKDARRRARVDRRRKWRWAMATSIGSRCSVTSRQSSSAAG